MIEYYKVKYRLDRGFCYAIFIAGQRHYWIFHPGNMERWYRVWSAETINNGIDFLDVAFMLGGDRTVEKLPNKLVMLLSTGSIPEEL